MKTRNLAFGFVVAALLSLPGKAVVAAGPDAPDALELPEPVLRMIAVLPDVKRVESDTDGTFLIHSKMRVIGSRIMRNVEVRVAEDGSVLDWGQTPFAARRYTQEEIRSTGRTDIGDALVRLDPTIQIVR